MMSEYKGGKNNYEQADTVSTFIQSANMINDFSSADSSSKVDQNVNQKLDRILKWKNLNIDEKT